MVQVGLGGLALGWLVLTIWVLTRRQSELQTLRAAFDPASPARDISLSQYTRLRQSLPPWLPIELKSADLRKRIVTMIEMVNQHRIVQIAPTVGDLERRLFTDQREHRTLAAWVGAFEKKSVNEDDFPIVYAAVAQALAEYKKS